MSMTWRLWLRYSRFWDLVVLFLFHSKWASCCGTDWSRDHLISDHCGVIRGQGAMKILGRQSHSSVRAGMEGLQHRFTSDRPGSQSWLCHTLLVPPWSTGHSIPQTTSSVKCEIMIIGWWKSNKMMLSRPSTAPGFINSTLHSLRFFTQGPKSTTSWESAATSFPAYPTVSWGCCWPTAPGSLSGIKECCLADQRLAQAEAIPGAGGSVQIWKLVSRSRQVRSTGTRAQRTPTRALARGGWGWGMGRCHMLKRTKDDQVRWRPRAPSSYPCHNPSPSLTCPCRGSSVLVLKAPCTGLLL